MDNREFEKQWRAKYINRISVERNEDESDNKEEQRKRKIVVYKYSRKGLYESVIVARIPAFFYSDNGLKIIDKIEEENRVIIPPNYEEYPYEPCEFAGADELSTYYKRAKTATIDTLRFNSHDAIEPNSSIIENVPPSTSILIPKGENDSQTPLQQAFVLQ